MATLLHVTTLGKLFTHTCLCLPSSINWYRCKLEAKQAFYATHWPCVRGLAASAGDWLRATEMEISTTPVAQKARYRSFSCFSFWNHKTKPTDFLSVTVTGKSGWSDDSVNCATSKPNLTTPPRRWKLLTYDCVTAMKSTMPVCGEYRAFCPYRT